MSHLIKLLKIKMNISKPVCCFHNHRLVILLRTDNEKYYSHKSFPVRAAEKEEQISALPPTPYSLLP